MLIEVSALHTTMQNTKMQEPRLGRSLFRQRDAGSLTYLNLVSLLNLHTTFDRYCKANPTNLVMKPGKKLDNFDRKK